MRNSQNHPRSIAILLGLITFATLSACLLLAGVAGAAQDTLRPEADLYTQIGEWVYFGESFWYLCIDDVVSDGDDTYLYENEDNKSYIYRAGDWGGDGDPDSVEACFVIRKAEALNVFKVAIGRAGAPEAIFTWCGEPDTVEETKQSYSLFKYMMTTDPCTDAAWTTASLNNNSYGFGIRYAESDQRAVGRYTQGYVVVYSPEAAEGGNPLLHKKKRMGGIFEAENYHNFVCARPDRGQ